MYPRIQSQSSVTTMIIYWASVRTENQGGPEVTDWPAKHSNMACIPSTTRFPRSTMLYVLPCLTIPHAKRRNKPHTESRRIQFATNSHSPTVHRSLQQLAVRLEDESSLPPITNLCSHSRQSTPGYQHILSTTVPQFTGLHVRKPHPYV
jgi:hypothetical protein